MTKAAPKKPALSKRPAKKPTPKPVVEPVAVPVTQSQIPWVAIAIVLVGGYWVYTQKQVGPVNPVTPPLVVNSAIAKVVESATDKAAVKDAGRLYLAFADVASRIKSIPSSKLRAWVINADTYMFQGTEMLGKVPGFAAAKDAEFASVLGVEDRELNSSDIQKFVSKCREIALACGVTDGK